METENRKTPTVLASQFIRELEGEIRATRECLEKVPTGDPDWKPHEKSMAIGYLSQLVADIPRWIQYTVEKSIIDFATYPQFKGATNAEFVDHFEKSVEAAKRALEGLSDADLDGTFRLQHGEKVLFEAPVGETITSTINHLVHHRGQLTVYLRLLDVAVPSIYGPSADAGGFDTL